MLNLNEFAQEVHALAVEKGFYDPEPTDAELIAAIHSEISEAFEEWRANRPMVYYKCLMDTICDGECKDDATGCIYKGPKPKGIAAELIDVALRILDASIAREFFVQAFSMIPSAQPIRATSPDSIDYYAKMSLPELVTLLHWRLDKTWTSVGSGVIHFDTDSRGTHLYIQSSEIITEIFGWLRSRDIEPEALLLEKHEYNKTRPYRHGGKRI